MSRILISAVLAAGLALPVAAGAKSFKDQPDAPVEKIYDKLCRNCHGSDGKAQTKMGKKHEIDDMTDAAWQSKHSDAEIRDAIAVGVKDTKMKGYQKKLTDEQIGKLVQYVRAFGGASAAK